MKNAGVSHSDELLSRRNARRALAAGAVILLAIFPFASPRAEDDTPVTAAASPAASTIPSDTDAAAAATPPMAESSPIKAPPESAAMPLTAPPLASPPVEADRAIEPVRPTYTTPSVPPMDNPGDDWVSASPPATQEIPQAVTPATSDDAPVARVPPGTIPQSNDVSSYVNNDPDLGMGVGTARDFVAEGEETSPIGLEMRESRCKLKTGENVEGLLILKVEKDSAAAKAGLRSFKRAGHNVLEGLAIGAAMVFPPAILALPVIDYTEVGQSYDMIIGVDGSRVSNFVDFEERMRDLQPGELVYFSVVRNGKRIQIPVPVPVLNSSASADRLP
jgi:hypothetical protein